MARTRKRARKEESEEEVTESEEEEEEEEEEERRDAKRKVSAGKKKGKGKGKAAATARLDVTWEWGRGDGSWVSYDAADSDKLEAHFVANKKQTVKTDDLSFMRTDYAVDFKAMTQTNLQSKRQRHIRRIAVTRSGSCDDTGYASLVRTHSDGWRKKKGGAASAAGSAPASPAASTGKAKGKAKKAAGSLGKLPPKWKAADIKHQASLGAQSLRSMPKPYSYGHYVTKDKHGSDCFDRMLANEGRLCGEWAVFYHSYSLAALLYEVQAAVACVLFRFKSNFSSLPRILIKPFEKIGDAATLLKEFPRMSGRDHHPDFRAVGICATTNLLATDPEAPPTNVFLSGYSCSDLSFMGVLERLLESCGVPKKKVKKLAKDIVALSERHGLDVSQFGGKRCKSGRPGHLLQIFMLRSVVDKYVYAAHPYGVLDSTRQPIGDTLAGTKLIHNQVRIVAHPALFMRANLVRMFCYSADPTFHRNRETFQEELTDLLQPILGTDSTRVDAATGIFAGTLPNWWTATSQMDKANVANKFK